ncbi:hypothetical protein BJ741DRAFT_577484 [Chytriomyces cf. hyalinus JEL632]|nr:hypothetical protein BJ741DRAFT_577484 [Chytriomyces cf. hyalinus JEL632]
MNSLVTASQFADGTITATLILNDNYISSLPQTPLFNTTRDQQQQQQMQSSYTISVTFSSTTGTPMPLCAARATVGPVLWDTCPMEVGGRACMRVSCQSMPGTLVSETVKAVFSVCPSVMSVDECAGADGAVVRVVKRLGMAGGGVAVAAGGTMNAGATSIATASVVTTNAITTTAAGAKETSANDDTQTDGGKTAVLSTATSTSPNMVASVVGGGIITTKGTDQAPNLALIIVPALVVLAAIAVGVHLYLKRRAAALDVDVDAEERGITRRKGSTDKKDAFQPELNQGFQQTRFQNTSSTAALTMSESANIERNATTASSVFTKQVRLQNLPAGQVRYMRGAPGPILIPGPPALSPSSGSPTSMLGLASTFSLGRKAGHVYQGNPNIPSAAAPVPSVPAVAKSAYDTQDNYRFY